MSGSSPSLDAAKLLEEIEVFLKETDMGHNNFGKRALNNTHVVMRLRAGCDISTATAEKLRRYMMENRP